MLAASEQLPSEPLESHVLFGELALDGTVRALPAGHAGGGAGDARGRAAQRWCSHPSGRARRQLIEGLEVAVVERLTSAVRVLAGGPGDPLPERSRRGDERGRDGASRGRT